MKRSVLLQSFIVVILILTLTYSTVNPIIEDVSERPTSFHTLSVLTPHEPIVIGNDTALAVWPGSGTEGDPYRIEGLNITSENASIRVENTTKHFVIENCYLKPLGMWWLTGIQIANVSDGSVLNCTITSGWNGVSLYSSTDFTVMDCTIFNVSTGISFYSLNNTIISNNIVHDIFSGISGGGCSDTVVSANHVFNWQHMGIEIAGYNIRTEIIGNFVYDENLYYTWYGGITLVYASGVRVDNNSVYNNHMGIYVDFLSTGCQITNNEIENCTTGVYVMWSNNITIDGNRITDVYMGFYVYDSQNISILNNDIFSEVGRGIYLSQSKYCELKGNTMENAGIEIGAMSPTYWNHTVENNYMGNKKIGYIMDYSDTVIEADDYSQIIMVFCQNVTVTNGVFSNANIGVIIAYSDGCGLRNSVITENTLTGIELFYVTSCTISDCNITQNGLNYYGSGGLSLQWTDGTLITRNRIYSNNGTGISTDHYGSRNCIIYNNVITNNTLHGIYLSYSTRDNIVYGNVIGWNELGNAQDDGTNNTWDNGLDVGNWWSDYNGTGVYKILGEANATDRFPQNCTIWGLALPISDPDLTVADEFDFTPVIIVAGGLACIILIIVVLFKKKAEDVQTQTAIITEEGMK